MLPEYVAIFIFGLLLAAGAAVVWVLYLVKLVTHEEDLLERIRTEIRRREEERRIREDRRRRLMEEEGMDMAKAQNILRGGPAKPAASAEAGDGDAEEKEG